MTAPAEISQLREHDIVQYTPPERWCREGMAEAITRRDGTVALVDTYWESDRNVVAPTEYELLFNLNDYELVPGHQWERFAPADRQIVTSQHGLRRRHYVRKGATESRDQVITNAREALAEAERAVESAVRDRDWRQRELDELLSGASS